ncbi:SIMPL domain-containing protein [Novosphingobium aerophilum]|uniref:SIMPL domain-containing protein n=1 Tax=Novosphingobium aerophilum TaxID=2839843 RepID=A0A7X1F8V3_9SPHN|nr:SIMPL domain-containing protein [Novosphingobium aerophilum]MBC2652513.1 SIMPL domain-containing protein [Novosphingobium aerophilum]
MTLRPFTLATALAGAAVLGALPIAVQAQTAPRPSPAAVAPTLLSLSAEGRVTRAPDVATFSAGVVSQGTTASEALRANAADMTRVIAALKKAGVADKDIQTSNLSLSPVYQPQRNLPDGTMEPAQPRIIGYQANNSVSVRHRNLGDLGKVIDALVSAGANQVNGPGFEVDNPDPAQDEARTTAMTKARARAELYARAAGLRVGRIVSISESGGWQPPQPVMYRMAAMEAAPAPSSPVQAGELQMTVTVQVQFELVP